MSKKTTTGQGGFQTMESMSLKNMRFKRMGRKACIAPRTMNASDPVAASSQHCIVWSGQL